MPLLLRAFLLKSSSGKTLWKTQRNLKKSFCTCLGVYWEIYVCLWVFTGFFTLLDGMNQWVLARGSLLTKAFWIKGMPARLGKGVPGKCTLPPGFVHNPGASANGLLKIDCERWPQIKCRSSIGCFVVFCWCVSGLVLGWVGVCLMLG